jgi:LmeA-like phospholipid-binding
MPDQQNLEEQILSRAAENTITDRLDEVEKIDVDVRTDLLKMVQGQVAEVSLTGQGLVLQKDIRVQEIKLTTDSIAVNPLSAIFGQIELNEPVNATARIVMTEVDINSALSSDLIKSQTLIWNLNVDDEIVSLQLQQIQVSLPGSCKIEFSGTVLIKEKEQSRLLSFTARVRPPTHSQPLILESFNCTQGEGISIPLITTLMPQLKELLKSSSFVWENMRLSVKDIEVKSDNLILLVEAHVKQIPSPENLPISK